MSDDRENLEQIKASLENALNWIKSELLKDYPPEPEQWRDAVWPDDWNKEARFSDHADKDGTTTLSRLCGLYKDPDCHHWLDASNSCWDKCQVRVTDEEHIADAGEMVDDADAIPKLRTKYHALYAAAQRVVEKHDAGSLSGKGDSAAIDELRERLKVNQ